MAAKRKEEDKEKEQHEREEKEMGISEEQSKTKSQNFCLEMKFDFNASGCKRSPVTTPEGGGGEAGQSVDWVTLGLATHQRHQAVYEAQAQRACDNSSAISLTAYVESQRKREREKRGKAWWKTAKRRRRKVLQKCRWCLIVIAVADMHDKVGRVQREREKGGKPASVEESQVFGSGQIRQTCCGLAMWLGYTQATHSQHPPYTPHSNPHLQSTHIPQR